jgi:RNA polymerase sigma-70 factor (ECF subfamily)
VTQSSSFDALLKPHLDALYRLAYRLTGARSDAEDLVQEVLIKLYVRRDELAKIDVLGVWLKRVLFNCFVDQARRDARKRIVAIDDLPAGADALVAAAADPEADTGRAFDKTVLQRALVRLSVEHRTVLLMHDAEGYKLEEIQLITGIPIGTIKSRLHRARERLRDLLSADGTFEPRVACKQLAR